MNEFWTESTRHETGWKYYEGPFGLFLKTRDANGRVFVELWAGCHGYIIGEGATEQEAIADWLCDAEDEAEEAERELDALHEAIAAIRELKGE